MPQVRLKADTTDDFFRAMAIAVTSLSAAARDFGMAPASDAQRRTLEVAAASDQITGSQ